MSDEPAELLAPIVAALDAAAIPYMVVGSIISMYYGEPRTTYDLDLVIDPSHAQLEQLLAAIDPERFYVDPDVAREALQRRTMFNIIDMTTAWKLDLVIRKAREFSIAELARRTPVVLDGIAVTAATAEDTIISKLEWSRASGGSERQLRDVAGILRVRGERLDFAYVERWVSSLELSAEWLQARTLAAR